MEGLGEIMYITETPDFGFSTGLETPFHLTEGVLSWAKQCYANLKAELPGLKEFWKYMDKEWIPKIHMWVTGNRHIPHAGQDTNAAIESYHGNMKAILRESRGRLVGRRVDWLIHTLTGDVINRYEYNAFRKDNGFVPNKSERTLALSAIVAARKIKDSDVQLPSTPGDPASVRSTKHTEITYKVYNPSTDWAVCECIQSRKGMICKHQVKVLQIMRPELADGKIARVLGTLRGTAAGGVPNLSCASGEQGPSPPDMFPTEEAHVPESPPRRRLGEIFQDEEDLAHQLILKLLERAYRVPVVWRHLMADLRAMEQRHAALEAQVERGILHPQESGAQEFVPNNDGRNNSLKRARDFLERRGYR